MALSRVDLAAAGLPDPLDRALSIGGALLLIATILPAGDDAGRAIFLVDLLDADWGGAALASMVLAGTAALLLGRATSTSRVARAIAAIALLVAVLACLFLQTETTESILPHQPLALRRGALLYLLSVTLSGAALIARRDRTLPRWQARWLGGLSFTCAFLLFIWPHRSGALAGALDGGTGDISLALAPLTIAALTALRVMLPGQPRASELAWMLALPSGIALSLGLDRAVVTGADVHFILALRSVVLLVATVLIGAFSLHTLLAEARARTPAIEETLLEPAMLRLGLLLSGSAALSATIYAGAATTPEPPAPALSNRTAPAPWTDAIYTEILPAIAHAATLEAEHASPFDPTALPPKQIRDQLKRVFELARPAPQLARAIEELVTVLQYRSTSPRAIAHAEEHVNRAAEQAGIPYWVDVQLIRYRSSTKTITKILVSTYRITRVRAGRAGSSELRAMWLERADGSGIIEQRLGWKRPGEQRGMVVLDGVRARLRTELSPALRGEDLTTTERLYARVADRIEDDLIFALSTLRDEDEATLRAMLARYLDCQTAGEVEVEDEDACAAASDAIEPSLLDVLATNVEAHELQHVIDRDDVYVPRALKRAMKNRGEDLLHSAAAELSSYLGEMGRGLVPRLALVDLAAFMRRYPKSAEGFAGQVAMATMLHPGETFYDLLRLPQEEIAARAREAYETLFNTALPETELPPLNGV